MLVQEGEGLHVRKLMTDISAECRVQGEVRVSTCQALLACVDGVGVVLVARQLDALAGDESHELGCKTVEVAYEEIGLEACGKAMRKAAINGDDEVTGRDRGDVTGVLSREPSVTEPPSPCHVPRDRHRRCGRCRSCALTLVDELA